MLSFDIKYSRDLLQKLIEDFEELKNNPLSSRIAINCAMTAWHLTDWVFKEYIARHGYAKTGEFRDSLGCPSLFIMHDIANGSKHLEVSRPKSIISETEAHNGFFGPAFFDFKSFDVDSFKLIMENGEAKLFTDEVARAVTFWKQYLDRL